MGLNRLDAMTRLCGKNEIAKAQFDDWFFEAPPVFPCSHKVEVTKHVRTQPAKSPLPGRSPHDVNRKAEPLQNGANP